MRVQAGSVQAAPFLTLRTGHALRGQQFRNQDFLANPTVPHAWQERVREAVNDYRKLQELIEAVSESAWKRLRERTR
jgi:hypothetical protein